jgi:hypothetical protein
MRVLSVLALSVFLAVPLAGCDHERATATAFEPGKYQGKTDPLLAKTKGGANDEAIKKRFAMIQTDR